MREKLDAVDLGERSEQLRRKAIRALVVAPIVGFLAGGVVGILSGMMYFFLFYTVVIGVVVGTLAGWSVGSERARKLRRASEHARREMLLLRKL